MSRRTGFTLIELSIAIFIIAMLLALCAPAFVRSYNDMQLREAARTFATTCQYGRILAVEHQTNAVLHIDLDRQKFWLTQNAGEAGDVTLKNYDLSVRVTLAGAELVDGPGKAERAIEVNFYRNGTCDSATVVFRGEQKTGLAATIDPVTCKAVPYAVKL